MANDRVSQVVVEVLGSGSPKARTSQIVVEALGSGSPKARVSQSILEALVPLLANVAHEESFGDTLTFTDVITAKYGLITDTVTFTDVFTGPVIRDLSLSDTLTINDYFLSVIEESMSDTLTFSDSTSADIWKIGNFTDALTLTESLLNQFVGVKTLAEAIDFIDQIEEVMVLLLQFSDNVTFTDSLNGVAVKVLGDTCTFTDVITAFVSKVFKDTIEFTDIISEVGAWHRNMASVLTFYDSLTYTAVLRKSLVADAITFSDTMVGYRVTPLIPDSITFSDSIVGVSSKPISDTLALTDSLAYTRSFNVSMSDSLNLTDQVHANKVLARQINDLLNFIEDNKGIRQRFGVMNDLFTFSDTMLREVHVLSLDDSITFIDTMTFTKDSDRTLQDSLSYSDVLNVLASFTRTFNDSVVVNDGFLVKLKPGPNSPPGGLDGEGVVIDPVVQGVIKILPQLVLTGFSRSIILPPPEFNDFVAGQGKIAVQRSMTGNVRVYAKRTSREKLNFHWVLPKYKSDELKLFLRDEINNPLKMIDWEGNYWNVKILSNSVDFTENRRWSPCGNAVDVTIEFVGTRYA